jgi:hypothetical protein
LHIFLHEIGIKTNFLAHPGHVSEQGSRYDAFGGRIMKAVNHRSNQHRGATKIRYCSVLGRMSV